MRVPASIMSHATALVLCRAKFITGSAAALSAKPGGGAAWLLGLRSVPYAEASEALCTLPGIGPKVRVPSHLEPRGALRMACSRRLCAVGGMS